MSLWAPIRIAVSAVLVTCTFGLTGFAQQANSEGDLNTIVERMTAAQLRNHDNMPAYTVVREYTLKSGETDSEKKSDSNVTAEVNFVPPGTKEYSIRTASGSGRGEKVVRRVLEHETAMAGDFEKTALTPNNYKFELLGREQHSCNCYILAITPKRDSGDLIKGKAWIDASNFYVRRIEGQPAKSPSWWIKKVDVVLLFNEVSGFWLQTAAHAEAEVRLFGRHTLESRDIDVRTAEAVAGNYSNAQRPTGVTRTGARNSSQAPRGRSTPVPVLGSGIVMR